MELREQALALHRLQRGKLSVESKVPLLNKDDLSLAYTPGVAEPCKEIHNDPQALYEYTGKGNLVAVVTDGSAVLGLGDIGPEAALPVMEGKAALFKAFAGVDAIPICLATRDSDEIVRAVELIAPGFGGINLEDISAPRCFEIEDRLRASLPIPVMHDDQHGTAIVVLAALQNAFKLTGRSLTAGRVVINGAGAAGTAIAKLLLAAGLTDLILCDRDGILQGDDREPTEMRRIMAKATNPRGVRGTLADALRGADVFIGVSAAGALTEDMVSLMSPDGIVFAMANPVPEIWPEAALGAGAAVVGTGRSDFPNQINNVLAFPGIFRGVLDARVGDITETMKLAAAQAIAQVAEADGLRPDYIIPDVFDKRVVPAVADAVARAAKK